MSQLFRKLLSKTDTGQSNTHQAGLLIPKTVPGLLEFLPRLDASQKNPSAEVLCRDESNKCWSFRFIYYNGKLFRDGGTRNEFRLTRTTEYLKSRNAQEGDIFEITILEDGVYSVRIIPIDVSDEPFTPRRVKLSGWQRLH